MADGTTVSLKITEMKQIWQHHKAGWNVRETRQREFPLLTSESLEVIFGLAALANDKDMLEDARESVIEECTTLKELVWPGEDEE